VSFASPLFLLGLLLIPLAVVASYAARRRARRYAVRFTAAPSLKLAAARAGGAAASWRRLLPPVLALAALAALVMALAKPERTVAVPVERATIMLVTDHSRSMLATDVEPNRLRAAQGAARTFIDELPDPIRIGAVAYSDAPDAVQSPTVEHDEARRIVDDLVADGGTATGDALQVALDTLQQSKRRGEKLPAAIVLLSDGKTTIGRDPVEVAREAGRLKIPVYTIALGTSSAVVPNPDPVRPPLPAPPDPESLEQIAEASGGRAFTAEDEDRVKSIYRTLGSQLGTKDEQREATSLFAVGGLVLLLGAAGASVVLSGRLP
jgi:Ca-activated chloride channel homolog